ncbi:MAG TPA: cellulase family glycosylhydrolase [Bacteroidales bacterium]|nr:cellulase family glycosylhydrolase [Bacteroidales bacterium]
MLQKCILFISVIVLFSCNSNDKSTKNEQSTDIINPSGFVIHRGINISHWLSQVYGFSKRDVFFTKDDIRLLDSLGFDHIRLPIDEKEMWDETGKPIAESFSYLRKAIEWCMEYDMKVIVDLHIIRSFYFNAINEGHNNTLFTDEKE